MHYVTKSVSGCQYIRSVAISIYNMPRHDRGYVSWLGHGYGAGCWKLQQIKCEVVLLSENVSYDG